MVIHKLRQAGFSLVELVIVITIAGIVAALSALMIGDQMLAFVDSSRRSDLVNNAETAVRYMAKDIRRALPNSLRTTSSGSREYLEFVPIEGAGRYRAEIGATSAAVDVLDFSLEDDSFQVIGVASAFPSVNNNSRLVIYNIGQVDGSGDPVDGANVYAGVASDGASGAVPVLDSHVITAESNTISYDALDSSIIELATAHQFAFESPQKRFYVVEGAVTYECDPVAQEIIKYSGYTDLETDQPDDSSSAPLSGATSSTVIDKVTACEFNYAQGNAQRSALLTITLTIEEDGESINLLHQVHVDNAP